MGRPKGRYSMELQQLLYRAMAAAAAAAAAAGIGGGAAAQVAAAQQWFLLHSLMCMLIVTERQACVVLAITQSLTPGFRWHRQGMLALQEAAEAFVIGILEDANLCAIHAKRITVQPRDLECAKIIRGRNGDYLLGGCDGVIV
eukprot:gene4527-biopygen6279